MVCPYRSASLILFVFFILFAVFFFPLESFAHEADGEIINVNHQYKIAFTDLTDQQLKKGDIVGIYKDRALVGYMQVVTAGSVISKLLWKETLGRYTNSLDFSKIDIGESVVKLHNESESGNKVVSSAAVNALESEGVNPSGSISVGSDDGNSREKYKRPVCKENEELNRQFKQLSANYVSLSETLKGLMDEKKRLDIENKQLRQSLAEKEQNIKLLKERNVTCKNELSNLRAQLDDSNCEQNNQKIKELKSILLKLRQRIKYLEKLLSGE